MFTIGGLRERHRGAAAKLIGAKKPSPLAKPRTPLLAADKLRPIAVSEVGKRGNGKWRVAALFHKSHVGDAAGI